MFNRITPTKGVTLNRPNKLYKYEPYSEQALSNLKKQIIYFGSPAAFNDPYDCALNAGIRFPTKKEVETFRLKHIDFKGKPFKEVKLGMSRLARTVLNKIIRNFRLNRGVSCFSENNDELLMWAYYGQKYTGFCLEFDTTRSNFFCLARKVTYDKNLPVLDIQTIIENTDTDEIVTKLFSTKSKSWEYESEWRLFHEEAGKKCVYKREDLTGVYFGSEMNKDDIQIICSILQDCNPKVGLFYAKWKQAFVIQSRSSS